jgi:DICT domain-containing protein
MLSQEAKRRQREAQSEMGIIEKPAHKTTIQRTETSQIRMERRALDGKSTTEYRTL